MIIKEKRYIKKCDCGTEIIYTRRDCYHNTTWDIYSLYCPSCSHEYSYRRGTHHDLFDKEYEEDSVDKDEEIERLNKELETLKQPQVFIDTQDMEERYGEELYKEYLEKENKRLNNKLKDIKSQLDYLETYSSKEDVFEDMKGRLDRINKIIGSDKE